MCLVMGYRITTLDVRDGACISGKFSVTLGRVLQ